MYGEWIRAIAEVMCSHEVTEELEREALSRWFDLLDAADVGSALEELDEWIQQDPAHEIAWDSAVRLARLAALFLRAAEPGAGKEELEALVEAMEERANVLCSTCCARP
jgi:ferric-dicitrate binding protein FerR (iron transport regulator)